MDAQGRASAVNVGLPWRGSLPAPDATIDQADRQHAATYYSGILAQGGAPEPEPTGNAYWLINARRRGNR